MAQEVRKAHQQARGQRQGLLHVLEDPDDLRHDPGQQAGHDGQGDQGQQQRIGQRREQGLLEGVACLGVVGQLVEHGIEMAGLFAGGDRGPEDLRKAVREVGHGLGQAGPFHDARAQRYGQCALAFVVVLLGQGGQGFVDRQTGADQGRQLPGQHGQLDAGETAPRERQRPAPLFGGFLDRQRIEAALAQGTAYGPRRIALQHAALGFAVAVERLVCECGHADSLEWGESAHCRRNTPMMAVRGKGCR